MFADPQTTTGSTDGVNDTLTFVRTSMNGSSSKWVASNPSAGWRVFMDIRHSMVARPKGLSYPTYRSNVLFTFEKWNSTTEKWERMTSSFTLVSPGLNGPLSTANIYDAFLHLKSFLVTANIDAMLRQEV